MSSRVGTCSPCHARTRQAVCACTTAAARNYIRVASSSREAGREELERLYQASGRLRYGQKPVPGAGLDALDQRRLRDYLCRVLDGTAPAEDDVNGSRSGCGREPRRQIPLGLVPALDLGRSWTDRDGHALLEWREARFCEYRRP